MSEPTSPRWERLDLLLLVFGPLTHGVLLAAAWAWGACWLSWLGWLLVSYGLRAVQLLGVAGTVALMIWQRNSTTPPTPQRNFSSTFLFFTVALSILVPWGDVLDMIRTDGRHRMEAQLRMSAVAEECLQLAEQYAEQLPAAGWLIEVPPPYPPAIAKLGDVSVLVTGDGVVLELGSQFVPYEYRFFQTSESGDWVLVWVSPERKEVVATLPARPWRNLGEQP
jgi:hypothetical protein